MVGQNYRAPKGKSHQWAMAQVQRKALEAFKAWELPIKAQYANAFGLKGGLEPVEGDSPSMFYNIYRTKSGSNLVVNTTTGNNWTIAAVNSKRVQQLTDLRSAVEAHFTDYEFIPRYKAYRTRIQAISTGTFCLIPFAAILENGENIAATDYNGDSVSTAVSNAMPAAQNRSIIYGPLAVSKLVTANAVDRYICTLSYDFFQWANSLAQHIRSKRMAEENPVEFKIGICAIGSASQVIYWTSHDLVVYYLGEPRSEFEMGDN